MNPQIKILIVDDHEVVRLGLKTLFSRHADLVVVDEAQDGTSAIEKAVAWGPDVTVVDLKLGQESGVRVVGQIKARAPNTRILALTAYADDELLADAIVAGADGCILKEINSDRLVAAVRSIARGETLLEARVLERVAKRARRAGNADPFAALNWQERRILGQVAEGKSNRDIAAAVNLSEKTIRNYVSQILAKLDLASRTQAAAYALRHKLDLGA